MLNIKIKWQFGQNYHLINKYLNRYGTTLLLQFICNFRKFLRR